MALRINPIGKVYGRLTVTSAAGIKVSPSGRRRSLWFCLCECGGSTTISSKVLAEGSSRSCGCLQKDRVSSAVSTHRLSKSKMYKVWTAMKQRCHNPNDANFHRYGARGISVCQRWKESFSDFLSDVGESPQPGMSLDRINNDLGYEPGNVRWATATEQLSNTRRSIRIEHNGRTLSLKQWSVELCMAYTTLRQRINKGMPAAAAFTTPIDKRYSHNHPKRVAISEADAL